MVVMIDPFNSRPLLASANAADMRAAFLCYCLSCQFSGSHFWLSQYRAVVVPIQFNSWVFWMPSIIIKTTISFILPITSLLLYRTLRLTSVKYS